MTVLRLRSEHDVECVFVDQYMAEVHPGEESPYKAPAIVVRWAGATTKFPVTSHNKMMFVNAFDYWPEWIR